MANPPRISPATNRPTPYILGIVLLVLILIGAWWFLRREGSHRSNPTDGHTSLQMPAASA